MGVAPLPGRCVPACDDGRACIHRNTHGVCGHMPRRDRMTGGPSSESGRVRRAFARRRMGSQREPAHLGHTEFALFLRPGVNGFYRLAWTMVLWTFFFEERKNAFGLHRRQERKATMIACVALKRSIRCGLCSRRAFHRRYSLVIIVRRQGCSEHRGHYSIGSGGSFRLPAKRSRENSRFYR